MITQLQEDEEGEKRATVNRCQRRGEIGRWGHCSLDISNLKLILYSLADRKSV